MNRISPSFAGILIVLAMAGTVLSGPGTMITPGPLPDPVGNIPAVGTTRDEEITCASILHGEVSPGSPTNGYVFNGSAGQVVIVKVVMTSGEEGFFPRISVKNPSGQEIGGNSWLFSRLATPYILLADGGRYRIEISDDARDGDQAGAYDVSLQSPTGTCGKIIQSGTPVAGRLGSRASQDVWLFDVVAGDRVHLKAVRTGGDGAFLAALTVISPLGLTIGGNRPLVGQPETGIITIPESGIYTAHVTESEWDGQQTGDYDLSLVVLSDSTARSLECGHVVSNDLKRPSEIHVWSFSAELGDAVLLNAERREGDRDFVPGLMIVGPSGQVLGGNSPLFSRTDTGMLRILESGTHWVIVAESRWDGDQIGRYALALQSVTDRCVPSLDDSWTAEGAIFDPIQCDMWRFQARAGDAFTLQVSSAADPASGAWIATVQSWEGAWSIAPSGSAEPFVVPADGAYWVGIQRRDGGVGPYALSLRPHLAIRLDRSASGSSIDWLHANARLQTAPSSAGPWTVLTNVSRPFKLPDSAGIGFFRLVHEGQY